MNAFFRTFFTCLFVSLAFLAYKFISDDSYNSNLKISKQNPVFGIHNDKKYQMEENNNEPVVKKEEVVKKDIVNPKKETPNIQTKKNTTICYFYGANGQLIPVKRELEASNDVKNAILLLLKGPTIAETRKGMHSEIPANVDLISIKNNKNSITINLSSNFGNGGGTESVENRVKQLSKTVKKIEPNKSIYLYINGEEVEYLGGDGVYIKQPLE